GSTSPSVPTPVRASASAAGQPRPPTPITSARTLRASDVISSVVVSSVDLKVIGRKPGKIKNPTPSNGRGVSRVLRFLIFLEARRLVSDLAPAFRRLSEPVAVASQGRSLRHSG